MKRYLYVVTVVALVLAYVTPGELIVQLGLRKIAFEQGVAQARQHHSWVASVDAEEVQVAQAEPAPAKKTKERRR